MLCAHNARTIFIIFIALVQVSKVGDCILCFSASLFYYIKFIGMPSGSKSIKTLSRQWRYHFYPHMCDIIVDQSARSIFAHSRALVVFKALVDFI